MGADTPVHSDFQLIAGTNRDLQSRVREGKFRDDLLARINLWTFPLPGLRARPEDLEPNLQFELENYAQRTNTRVTFSREARKEFLDFALSPAAAWKGNFRDLNGAVTRMATLALGGRIAVTDVWEETDRLRAAWDEPANEILATHVAAEVLANMDLFDKLQLEKVLEICLRSRSLSEAGRELFSASQKRKASTNDADRLRKYLARFGVEWARLHQPSTSGQ
jgi:transcriptional regulatory protein RtcR